MYISQYHRIVLLIIFGNCFRDTTEIPHSYGLTDDDPSDSNLSTIFVPSEFKDENTTSLTLVESSTTENTAPDTARLEKIRECKLTVREVVNFYVSNFIDNDPTTNDKLTKCNVWDNCTWYVEQREKFSENPRPYVDGILNNMKMRFDDGDQEIVDIDNDFTRVVPSANVSNIKDLPLVLKLFWFLNTIRNQPLDDNRDHPSFLGWKEMLSYFEYNWYHINSLGFAQILSAATKRLNQEPHNPCDGKMKYNGLCKPMIMFTMCVRCLVENTDFITPEFLHIQSKTTTSPASTTPKFWGLVSRMSVKYAPIFQYIEKYSELRDW